MAQIKKGTSLRKAILQAAITGQLISSVVEPVETTEGESLPLAPASKLSSATPSAGASPATPPETGKQLLDRIIEERNNKLLAEWEEKQTDLFASNDAHSKNAKTVRSEQIRLSKKIKKPEPIVASEIDEDEIPFEIPENWCWCRVKDIFLHQTGKTLNKDTNKEGIELDYLTTSNVYWNSFDFTELRTMKFKESEIERYSVKKGDLLILEGGEYRGRTAVWNLDRKVAYQNHLHRLRAYIEQNPYFYSYVMQAYRADGIIYAISKGEAIPAISSGVLGNLLIPLPPLAIQNAIVEKLEQVLPLVDAYENALLQKEELKNALPDKVKKAILQEAITGQLTEAWRKSATIKESGKQLLDRIIEERNAKALAEWEESLKKNVGGKATLPSFASKTRAKKPVPIVASEIEEEDIPFEVPENWCWCRLGDVCYKIGDIDHKMPKEVLDGIPYISPKDFTDIDIDFSKAKKISQKDFDDLSKKMKPKKGDIIFPRYGTIGTVRFVNVDFNFLVSYSCCTISTMRNLVSEYYIFYMLQSKHIKDEIDKYINKTTQPNVGLESIKQFLIPLPPLEEQEEIIKKVEELLPLCK